jgi:hypothetical protein
LLANAGAGIVRGTSDIGAALQQLGWNTAKFEGRNNILGIADPNLPKLDTSPIIWEIPEGEGEKEINQRREQATGVNKIVSELGYSTGRMLPSVAVSAATGMPIAGTSTLFLSSYGDAYKEAVKGGKTEEEATTYAILTGTSEAAMQYALGGISQLGGVAAKPIIKNAIAAVSESPAVKFALTKVTQMLGQGSEEYLQSILEPVYRNIAFKEKNEFKVYTDEAKESAIVGALMIAIFNIDFDTLSKSSTDIQNSRVENDSSKEYNSGEGSGDSNGKLDGLTPAERKMVGIQSPISFGCDL